MAQADKDVVLQQLIELIQLREISASDIRTILEEFWKSRPSHLVTKSVLLDVCELESSSLEVLDPLQQYAWGYVVGQKWIAAASTAESAGIRRLTDLDRWPRIFAGTNRPIWVLATYVMGNGHGEPFSEQEDKDGWELLGKLGKFGNSSTSLFWILGFVEAARIGNLTADIIKMAQERESTEGE